MAFFSFLSVKKDDFEGWRCFVGGEREEFYNFFVQTFIAKTCTFSNKSAQLQTVVIYFESYSFYSLKFYY